MKKEEKTDFIDRLCGFTETLLTSRARRQARKREKQKARGVVLEWLDAFLWAVMVVLLLNQYILQAYQIPSGSMRNTLIGGVDPLTGQRSRSDRIFVNKFIFGPELLPGLGKLPGFRTPRRGEVIIFENPEYKSPSLFHEIAQRILYMATLSLVDINQNGSRSVHQFLIKRGVAVDGDSVIFREGKLFIRPRGEALFYPESEFKKLADMRYGNHLLLDKNYYESRESFIVQTRLDRVGLPLPETERSSESGSAPALRKRLGDPYEDRRIDSRIMKKLYPQNEGIAMENAVYEQGLYVPEGWMLPLGDNRSDSLDGRYFGPLPKKNILGRALFKYWPLGRIGIIR